MDKFFDFYEQQMRQQTPPKAVTGMVSRQEEQRLQEIAVEDMGLNTRVIPERFSLKPKPRANYMV